MELHVNNRNSNSRTSSEPARAASCGSLTALPDLPFILQPRLSAKGLQGTSLEFRVHV